MNKQKAFIFDLDGVIVDTAKYHFTAWKQLANSLGFDFSKVQNEKLKGISRAGSLTKILDWGGISLSQSDFDLKMNEKNQNYLKLIEKMDKREILPNISNILAHLRAQKQGIALGSASKNAKLILKKIGLIDLFDVIVDGNDVINGKPDPEVFLKAAKGLGISPKKSIVFEDAVAGIQAANKAKMTSIAIGEAKLFPQAKYVFKDTSLVSVEFINELIKK